MVRRYWSGGVVWLFIYSEMYIIRKKGVLFKLIFLKKWLPWVVKHLPFQQDKYIFDSFDKVLDTFCMYERVESIRKVN